MWPRILLITVGLYAYYIEGLATENVQKSTEDLAMFIGKWRFTDEATELAGFDYTETGITDCRLVLQSSYLQCSTTGTSKDKTRSYFNFLNYNSISDQYEWVGMFSNHPEKFFMTISIAPDGKNFEMFGSPIKQKGGITSKNWSQIKFISSDKFIWETRVNKSNEPPDHWPLKFIGTYTRVE